MKKDNSETGFLILWSTLACAALVGGGYLTYLLIRVAFKYLAS